MVLHFVEAEKQHLDTVVFPSFDLSIEAGAIIAIHSSVNIRQQIMSLLLGKGNLSGGEIQFQGGPVAKKASGIGLFFLESGFYERLDVQETLRFFHQLYDSTESVEKTIKLVQLDLKRKTKVENLTFSEKKRLQFGCLFLQNPIVYILEEPDQNLDHESKRILFSLLQQIQNQGKGILLLTGNMETAVTLGTAVYRLDNKGLHQVETADEETGVFKESTIEAEEINPPEQIQPIRFEKIPTKVNEKIVLFDPPEIDYIESSEGQSFLHINGETFPSFFTLNELEERLLPFGFFRCHRSYIVNLQKVREVITWTKNSYSLVLDDTGKAKIPLSKTKMVSLKEMLGLK